MKGMNLRVAPLAFALAAALVVSPVMAKQDKDKVGGPHKSEQAEKKGGDKSHDSGQGKASLKFDDRQRDVLRSYFQTEFKRGSCPPGLAKKNNGCLPPGQAKKLQIGQRLPPDVIFHDLPDWVLRDLGRAPDGHRYVRVDDDVVLLGIATGVVIDVLSDLGAF